MSEGTDEALYAINSLGRLHRHADGTEHRHFRRGFTIGNQVIADDDGSGEHTHGILGSTVTSGPPVWVEEKKP